MGQADTSNAFSKVLKWIFFIPILYVFMILLKIGLLYAQFWIKDQVHEDSGWGYFVATTVFGSFWIPYLIEYLIIVWIISLCSKPKIGAAIALTLMVLSMINYYFVADNSFYLGPGLADIVMLGALGYISFSDSSDY